MQIEKKDRLGWVNGYHWVKTLSVRVTGRLLALLLIEYTQKFSVKIALCFPFGAIGVELLLFERADSVESFQSIEVNAEVS